MGIAKNRGAHGNVRERFEKAQKELQAQQQNSAAERSQLEARIKEQQAAHVEVEQKVASLKETLVQETRRRESAEQQVDEIGKHRNELETQLGKLRQELEA